MKVLKVNKIRNSKVVREKTKNMKGGYDFGKKKMIDKETRDTEGLKSTRSMTKLEAIMKKMPSYMSIVTGLVFLVIIAATSILIYWGIYFKKIVKMRLEGKSCENSETGDEIDREMCEKITMDSMFAKMKADSDQIYDKGMNLQMEFQEKVSTMAKNQYYDKIRMIGNVLNSLKTMLSEILNYLRKGLEGILRAFVGGASIGSFVIKIALFLFEIVQQLGLIIISKMIFILLFIFLTILLFLKIPFIGIAFALGFLVLFIITVTLIFGARELFMAIIQTIANTMKELPKCSTRTNEQDCDLADQSCAWINNKCINKVCLNQPEEVCTHEKFRNRCTWNTLQADEYGSEELSYCSLHPEYTVQSKNDRLRKDRERREREESKPSETSDSSMPLNQDDVGEYPKSPLPI